jgi:hypothetical protein
MALTEEEVDQLVLGVVQDVEENADITLKDSFADDIGLVSTIAKHTYWGPIHTRLAHRGTTLTIGPSAFDTAETVQDLADVVWGNVEQNQEKVANILSTQHLSFAAAFPISIRRAAGKVVMPSSSPVAGPEPKSPVGRKKK